MTCFVDLGAAKGLARSITGFSLGFTVFRA